MTAFERLKSQFPVTWGTVYAGWMGLGHISCLPEEGNTLAPLISREDVACFAEERLRVSQDDTETELVVRLLSLDLKAEPREVIAAHLFGLASLKPFDVAKELRKWRASLLEELLQGISADPLYGLIALTEFWLQWGCPADSPHSVQGRDGTVGPADYYTEENFFRALVRHRDWLEEEKRALSEI